METAQGLTLIGATITMGLVAGLFFTFAHVVMPGLGRTDDRTFVAGFQAIDKAIDNGWQAGTFLGAPVLTAVAALLHLLADEPAPVLWPVAALVLYGAVLAITFRVHLPLNREIQAADATEQIADLAAIRERFGSRWVRWNIARAALSTGAFGCLAWALLLFVGS